MRKLFSLLVVLLLISHVVEAFNNTMGLINIPTAFNRKSGQLETGFFYQYNALSSAIQLQNFFLSYSFSDYTEYALMVYSQDQIGHHIQQRVWSGKFGSDSSDTLALGIKDFGVTTANSVVQTPSLYMILSGQVYSNDYFEYNLGLGYTNPFATSGGGLQLFGGVQSFLDPARVLLEFDGNFWNAGMQFLFPPKIALSVGFNKLLSSTVQNEFVVGLSYRYDLYGAFEKKKQELEDEFKSNQVQLEDLRQTISKLPDPNGVSGSSYVTTVTVVVTVPVEVTPEAFLEKEKLTSADVSIDLPEILTLLQEGLDAYYKGDLETALEKYLTVLTVDPNIVMAHVRIGSIYYRLGNRQKAEDYWRRAYDLDPNNEELKKFRVALPRAAPP